MVVFCSGKIDLKRLTLKLDTELLFRIEVFVVFQYLIVLIVKVLLPSVFLLYLRQIKLILHYETGLLGSRETEESTEWNRIKA